MPPPLLPSISKRLKELIYKRLGDSSLKHNKSKLVDAALKLYVGCHCMINDNDDIAEGRANGTLCKVIAIKLHSDKIIGWKSYDGKKVFTANVNDVEYILLEHIAKTHKQKLVEASILKTKTKLVRSSENNNIQCQLKILEDELYII